MGARIRGGQLATIACVLWICLAAGFAAVRLAGDVPVDTDIQSMLPAGAADPVLRAAMDAHGQAAAGRVAWLVTAPDAAIAVRAAEDLERRLVADGLFLPEQVDAEATGRWLFANRNELLCEATPQAFDGRAAQAAAEAALARAHAPFGAVSGTLLASDPFLLTLRLADCLQPAGRAAPASHLVAGRIEASAFRLDAQDRLLAICAGWADQWAGAGVAAARAGAVFHAAAAASRAKDEVGLIGGIGAAGVVTLLLLVFRRPTAVLLTGLATFVGLVTGLAATLALFPQVHVLVFVFAAMLIGIVSDYALHVAATGPASGWAPWPVRRRLVARPITVSMLTTVLGFAPLMLFGVPLLQQVAVFVIVSIVSAWAFVLTVALQLDRRPRRAAALQAHWQRLVRLQGRLELPLPVAAALAALVLGGALFGWTRLAVEDDVRSFQPVRADLLAEQAQVEAAGGTRLDTRFLLSEGAGLDQAKTREEAALAASPDAAGLFTSRFDPSAARRAANADRLEAELYGPLLARQAAQLGLGEPAMAQARARPDGSLALPAWLAMARGEAAGSAFLLAPLLPGALAAAPALAGVRLVDPAERYSAAFATYRAYAVSVVLAAVAAAAAVLLLVYRRPAALAILLAPLLGAGIALGLQAAFGLKITFFSIVAILVLLGVGVDYSAYQWEAGLDAGKGWTALAVQVDGATTILSVGLLALSTTYPVSSFGLTVAIGVAAAVGLSSVARIVARRGLAAPAPNQETPS
jgi:predicted exporter